MAGLFRRLFKIGQAEAHSAVDKLEDPVKLTEQGIRDMKVDLDKSMRALAEVKALAIRTKREADSYKGKSQEYEKKAMLLLQKAQQGQIDMGEAERLAQVALDKKTETESSYQDSYGNQKKLDQQVGQLEKNIRTLRSSISKWENEAKTLKARAKVSKATANVNKQLSMIDSSSTVSMLERMKEKVEEQESLAEAYGDMADDNKSLDDELDSALSGSSSSDALAALKSKMGMGTPPTAIE